MIIALVISLIVGLIVGHFMIPLLVKAKFGQEVRHDGPESHLAKQGTPTMGGILFFFAIAVSMLISGGLNQSLFFLVFAAFGFGLTGFLDDSLKLFKRQSEGLTPKQKILSQTLVALIIVLWAIYGLHISTALWIPIFDITVDLGWLYIPFIIFFMVGTTNACNLTDGLDGLLSSVSFVVFIGYLIISYMLGMTYPAIFAAAMIGACVAFFVYNRHPAKVFMGDTGSFFIGGAVVGLAIITKTELLLVLLGMTFVLEALSDIIQVLVYKKTKKRVFRMAPLHHHFELGGRNEQEVVLLFFGATVVFVVLSIIILQMSDPSVLLSLQGV